jgi:hypothetical protein
MIQCLNCDRSVTDGSSFCPFCGAPAGSPRPASTISDELARMKRELDQDIRKVSKEIESQIASFVGRPNAVRKANEEGSSRESTFAGFDSVGPIGTSNLVHQNEVNALLMPTLEHIQHVAHIVLSSPFIRGNAQYRGRTVNVRFVYSPDDRKVNAHAGDVRASSSDGREILLPTIVVCGGLVSAIRAASLAFAGLSECEEGLREKMRNQLALIMRQMASLSQSSQGNLEYSHYQRLIQHGFGHPMYRTEKCIQTAQSHAAGMEMFVIAHEAGHICLGHTLGQRGNYDISRNQEREADSFAASLVSVSPFRDPAFIGQAFSSILLSWISDVDGEGPVSTHPAGRERLLNALASNSEAARRAADELGMTEEYWLSLLPSAQALAIETKN